MQIPEGTPYKSWYDEDGYQHIKFLVDKPIKDDDLHIVYIGNKAYHAEMYIKDAEMKKVKIKEAIRQIELYFEENKRDIEWSELGKKGRCLKDALYFLNEIKECVECK